MENQQENLSNRTSNPEVLNNSLKDFIKVLPNLNFQDLDTRKFFVNLETERLSIGYIGQVWYHVFRLDLNRHELHDDMHKSLGQTFCRCLKKIHDSNEKKFIDLILNKRSMFERHKANITLVIVEAFVSESTQVQIYKCLIDFVVNLSDNTYVSTIQQLQKPALLLVIQSLRAPNLPYLLTQLEVSIIDFFSSPLPAYEVLIKVSANEARRTEANFDLLLTYFVSTNRRSTAHFIYSVLKHINNMNSTIKVLISAAEFVKDERRLKMLSPFCTQLEESLNTSAKVFLSRRRPDRFWIKELKNKSSSVGFCGFVDMTPSLNICDDPKFMGDPKVLVNQVVRHTKMHIWHRSYLVFIASAEVTSRLAMQKLLYSDSILDNAKHEMRLPINPNSFKLLKIPPLTSKPKCSAGRRQTVAIPKQFNQICSNLENVLKTASSENRIEMIEQVKYIIAKFK